MSAPAVVFDLDGTLLDTMTLAPGAYVDTVAALGGPAVTPAEVVAAWHLGATPVVLAHFLGRAATPEDVECFHRHLETAAAGARPFAGVVEMVGSLQDEGFLLGVFTSATRRAATCLLASTGLDGHFPVLVCGDEVSDPKPAPEGLRAACRQLGVATQRVAYVGDAEVDLRCAAAAGAMGIHATWGDGTARLPGGHVVAGEPAEVVRLVADLR